MSNFHIKAIEVCKMKSTGLKTHFLKKTQEQRNQKLLDEKANHLRMAIFFTKNGIPPHKYQKSLDFLKTTGAPINPEYHSNIYSCFEFLEACEDILLETDISFLREAQMFSLFLDETTSGG